MVSSNPVTMPTEHNYQNINIARDADTPDEPSYQYYIPGQGLVSCNPVTMPTEHNYQNINIAKDADTPDEPTYQYYIPGQFQSRYHAN